MPTRIFDYRYRYRSSQVAACYGMEYFLSLSDRFLQHNNIDIMFLFYYKINIYISGDV